VIEGLTMSEKRAVLITGASSGIGLDATKRLLQKNYRVFACARKQEDLDRLQNEVGAEPVKLDVTDQEHIESLKIFLKENLEDGTLYALINNAGIPGFGPIECVPLWLYRKVFDVNVFGVISTTQIAIPYIRKAKGRIINISSISGRHSSQFLSPYCASKFALEAITDSLRRELLPFGVNVISINPGAMKTPIWDKRPSEETIRAHFSEITDQLPVYSTELEKFRAHFKKAEDEAEPVDHVTRVIVQALESKNPKTRYYVGKGMSLVAFMASHLPDKWMDWIIKKSIK
jgi:NAD(P)-dependent dehydrogenase (short-subunit alcohol dehydrogenase family)